MAVNERFTAIARCDFRKDNRVFGIRQADRRVHQYLIGKSGCGKSSLLAWQIIQDLKNDVGVGILDPHGDLCETILRYVPRHRTNEVVYFDPSDRDFPIGFNVLETVPPNHPRFAAEKNLVASGLVSVTKKLWADSWGPRLEHILRNTVLALLDSPGHTLVSVRRMLADDAFRSDVVARIRDPVVKSFWTQEFAGYSPRLRAEAVSPIQNKVGQFLSTSFIRNILGQRHSTINLRDLMDNGKILIMNLAKGKIGEDNSALLGAMMTTKIYLAAMERVDTPQERRRDFQLYADEFQTFATESFASILSESRKVNLNLTLAHQHTSQLPTLLRDAIFGNVGTIISFRLGAPDGSYLEEEFAPEVRQDDFISLPNYHAYIKLSVAGTTSRPFSMVTIPLPAPPETAADRETVLRVSRDRYALPRHLVEERISKDVEVTPLPEPPPHARPNELYEPSSFEGAASTL